MNIRSLSLRLFLALAVVFGFASLAQAQSAPGTQIMSISAANFTPTNSLQTYGYQANQGRYATEGPATFTQLETSLNLPNGALLDKIRVEAYDNDPAFEVEGDFYVCPSLLPCEFNNGVSTTGQPGWTNLEFPVGLTIDNEANSYVIHATLKFGSGTGLTMFRRVLVYYRLQPSPAPATATFLDVPTSNPYFQFVEALAASGLTAGCGGGNFCPDTPVTRGQMAVFLSKALGLYWVPAN